MREREKRERRQSVPEREIKEFMGTRDLIPSLAGSVIKLQPTNFGAMRDARVKRFSGGICPLGAPPAITTVSPETISLMTPRIHPCVEGAILIVLSVYYTMI